MHDSEIVELFWKRDQRAIMQSGAKYGKSLEHTSYSILKSSEDVAECVQDTYFTAWNKMPTDRPEYLGSYLLKIVRNISIDLYRKKNAQKRSFGEMLVFEELGECIPDTDSGVFDAMENGELARIINRFLSELDAQKRIVFVRRYFYSDSIKEIAEHLSLSESKVKSMLMRMRNNLAKILSEGGRL
jgi:RNA polymerase sigma-70 factor (ECF subfamily)